MDSTDIFYQAINNLIREYQNNPFNFLYESDLKAYLFSNLYQKYKEEKPITLKGGFWKNEQYGGSPSITTVPVKSEYPSGTRFDIAVLDIKNRLDYSKESAKERGWKNDRFWNQPLRIAAELKYAQLGYITPNKIQKRSNVLKYVRRDVRKLRNYLQEHTEFLGIAILFIMDFTINVEKFIRNLKWHKFEEKNLPKIGVYIYLVTPTDYQMFKPE